MAESIPPLRLRDVSGTPNIIPVFDLAISGGTITNLGGGKAQLRIDSGAGATGAPAGSQYVTLALDPTLTAERTLSAGTGLFLFDGGANQPVSLSMTVPVVVPSGGTGAASLTAFGVLYGSGASAVQALAAMVSGSLIVGSGATFRPYILPGGAEGQYLISTGGPVGNLAWVNTLGGASAITYAATGNQYVTLALAADLTAERVLTASTGITIQDGGANANVLIGITPPVGVGTGGTGQTALTTRGFLIGSGGSPVQVLAAMARGQLVVGSNAALAPQFLTAGSHGQTLQVDTSANLGVKWGWRTQRFPMALMTVAPDSANAFWSAKTGTTVDQGYVAYADSGLGWATYWTTVPFGIANTPTWNILVYNTPNSGSGGFCIFSLSARTVIQTGSIDTPYTNLVSVGTIYTQTANILGINTTGATNFDGTLTLSGGDLLLVELTRHGNLAGDAVNAQWNVFSVALQCDVI